MASARDRKRGSGRTFVSLLRTGIAAAARPKRLAGAALAGAMLLTAAPSFAQGAPCTRDELKKVTDTYIAAQKSGDTIGIPLNGWVRYSEQMEEASMLTGILSKPQKVDFARSLYDPQSCQSYTEVIITDPAHPYVLGTILNIREGRVNSIDTLVTDKEDWLFNAANTLKYSQAEKWTEIPAAERDSRQTIIAAADAYLNLFSDKSAQVPWGSPCARLEGGLYTAKGGPGVVSPEDTCNVGVPSGVKLTNRRYVVDEALGAVAVFLNFGQKERPDAHVFRVEKGKIRYIHTITVCTNEPNCGLPLPKELQTAAK